MCTLVIGRDILEKRTLWIAANRDEDPGRPSIPPAVLLDHPRVVGGRDRVAGGTWLALREDAAAVAMLNRRVPAAEPVHEPDGASGAAPTGVLRSRGLLALETAAAANSEADFVASAIDFALRSLAGASYAPFSMVIAIRNEVRILSHVPGGAAQIARVGPGWHVITHAELDDRGEPRTARLLADLECWRPADDAAIEQGLIARLSDHALPPVCIHEGRMVTVSSSLVHVSQRSVRYLHCEGRPCENRFEDRSALLGHAPAARESA